MKNAIIALLACGTLGALAIPAHADTAVIQGATQGSRMNGVGGVNVQGTTQGVQLGTDGPGENTGIVQQGVQGSDITGLYGTSIQDLVQVTSDPVYPYSSSPVYVVPGYSW